MQTSVCHTLTSVCHTLTSAIDANSVAVSTLTLKATVDIHTDAFTTDAVLQTLVNVYNTYTQTLLHHRHSSTSIRFGTPHCFLEKPIIGLHSALAIWDIWPHNIYPGSSPGDTTNLLYREQTVTVH